MTEKRFELNVNQNHQWDIVDLVESKEKNAICIYNDLGHYYFSSAKALCELLNELHEENQHLREALKKEYMAISGNLCDACKHEEEDNTNNRFVGIEYDVKCNKGHEILLDDEEQKCEDFELRLGELEE